IGAGLGAALAALTVLVLRPSPQAPVVAPAARAPHEAKAIVAAHDETPLSGNCERLAKRTAATIARVKSSIRDPEWKPPHLCVNTPGATWTLVVEQAGVSQNEGAGGLGFAVALVHVDAQGKETSVLPMKAFHETWKLEAGVTTVNVTLPDYWG